jgi:hypothetical protein
MILDPLNQPVNSHPPNDHRESRWDQGNLC